MISRIPGLFLLAVFLVLPASARAACTGPAGEAGTIIYNVDHQVTQFCNSATWIAMTGDSLWTSTGSDIHFTGGNVGIGITSPSADLHVNGDALGTALNDYTLMSRFQHANGNGSNLDIIGFRDAAGSDWTTAATRIQQVIDVTEQAYIQFNGATNNYGISLGTGGGAGGYQSATERVRITSSGNVGIGTTSPSYKLHVVEGGANTYAATLDQTNATNSNGLYIRTQTTNSGDAALLVTSNAGANVLFNVRNNGNVGVGTTSPSQKLHVSGEILASSAVSAGSALYGNWTSNTARANLAPSGYIWSTMASGGGSGNLYLHRHDLTHDYVYFGYNTGTIGSISTNGSSVAYNTTSDYRLKENIEPLQNALDRVMGLKPSRFSFKKDEKHEVVDGFIAHEVQDVAPYAVSGEKDAVDEKGEPDYQQLDYAKLTPLLTGAVQDLKNLFNELVEKLTGVVERLDGHDVAIAALTEQVRQLQADNDNLRRDTAAFRADNDNIRETIETLDARSAK